MDIENWIQNAGGRSEAARKTGFARTTINRTISNPSSVSYSRLREIALACGVDIDLTSRPLADPAANETARSIHEPSFSPTDQTAVDAWLERLERWGLKPGVDDPIPVLARAWNLLENPEVTLFGGRASPLAVASIGDFSDGRYALSGPVAMGEPGITVIRTENPEQVKALLKRDLYPTTSTPSCTVAVVPSTGNIFDGTWMESGIVFASPVQIHVDSLAIAPELIEKIGDSDGN